MDYYVVKVAAGTGSDAVIEDVPENGPAGWRYHEGKSLASDFPAPADLKFSDNFPEGRVPRDFVANIVDLLIVSPRVRIAIESCGETRIEFLPVRLIDHKGNVAAEDYVIANPLGTQDAIDLNKSQVKMNKLEKDQIKRIQLLALQEKGIDPGAVFFRAKPMRRLILMRQDLHEALQKASVTGLKTFPAEGWNGFDF